MLNEFYSVNSNTISETDGWKLNVSLNAEHPVYAGHFPEKAVVPGVMQTQMIKDILEQELGHELKMTEARNLKFLNLMLPENASSLDVELTVDQSEDSLFKVKGQATIDGGVYFKISAVFQKSA